MHNLDTYVQKLLKATKCFNQIIYPITFFSLNSSIVTVTILWGFFSSEKGLILKLTLDHYRYVILWSLSTIHFPCWGTLQLTDPPLSLSLSSILSITSLFIIEDCSLENNLARGHHDRHWWHVYFWFIFSRPASILSVITGTWIL